MQTRDPPAAGRTVASRAPHLPGHGTMELVIGNKNYSSWSMRPWVVMRGLGIPFAERKLR